MNEMRKGIMTQIRETLTSPREGFQSVQESDLKRGALVVLATAVLSAIASMSYMSRIPTDVLLSRLAGLNVDAGPIIQAMGTFAAVGGVIRVLVDWALLTLIMHALATLLAGKGSLKRFFAMTGFACLPTAAQQLLRIVDAYTVQPTVLADIFIANAQMTGVMKVIASMNVFTVFGVAALALKGYAVSANYGSTVRKGVLVAAAPYLLFVVLDLVI